MAMTRDEVWRELQFAAGEASDLRDRASDLEFKLEEIADGLADDGSEPEADSGFDDLATAVMTLYRRATERGPVTADQIRAAALAGGIPESWFDPDADDDEPATAEPASNDA
jgi:hypothetical protein